MKKIRLVLIDPELAEKYKLADSEVLLKQRPCLLVARLKYQGKFQEFAVPLRSNLNPSAKAQGYYFELPGRSNTLINRVHALEYRKMMPIERRFTRPFQAYAQEDRQTTLIPIQEHFNQIIKECQNYLDEYEKSNGDILFSTNIDLLLSILKAHED